MATKNKTRLEHFLLCTFDGHEENKIAILRKTYVTYLKRKRNEMKMKFVSSPRSAKSDK